MKSYKHHIGFTMVELLVVLLALALISMAAIPRFKEQGIQRAVNQAAIKVNDVLTAARRYRVDTESWPSTVNDLRPAYLTSAQASPPFGGSYNFTTSSTGDFFEIRFSASGSVYARRLLGRLPYARRVGVNDVIAGVGLPGWEPSFDGIRDDMDDLYPRDGSRPLTDALAGGDQDAVDLNNIEANLYVDREDPNYFLKPSGTSEMLRVNAQDVYADEVVAGRVRADALQMTDYRIVGRPCNSATGNIGITASREIVTCGTSGRWEGSTASEYRNFSSSLWSHSNPSTTTRYSATLPTAARDASAVALRFTCNMGGHNEGSMRVGNSYSGTYRTALVTGYADGRGGVNSQIFILDRRDASNDRIYIRHYGDTCGRGASVSLIGYWT